MRKLKLQMQVSVDGYVAGPNGEMDWMVWDWDDELKNYVKEITAPVDCILLGRVLAEGFIPHWAAAATSADPKENNDFAQIMHNTHKVVFSKTLKQSKWNNTDLASGKIEEEVDKLKNNSGKDLITYGGAGLASSLIKLGLIDEYHVFVNPAVLGTGMPIWKEVQNQAKLKLIKTSTSKTGIVVLCYEPVR